MDCLSSCPTAAPERGATALPSAAGGGAGGVDGLAVHLATVHCSALGIGRADDPPLFATAP